MKRVLEVETVGVMFWDLTTGRMTDANDTFLKLMGYSRSQVEAGELTWQRLTPPEYVEVSLAEIAKFQVTGRIGPYEKEYLRRRFAAVADLCRHSLGQNTCVEFCVDIAPRKRAEEELRVTADELARSNRELEQFAYISAHDLQEPLRQVRAYTKLLQERYPQLVDETAAQYLRFIYDGSARMTELIKGLLEYSRVGQMNLKASSTQQALAAALGNLKIIIEETAAHITSDELPVVLADPMQLAQLFQNLIQNAIKFRHDGVTPEIHISARRENRQWCFAVRDNGIGIEPQYYQKVFTIFQRLHTRDKYDGAGIGLSICKKIVEQHGGEICIDSTPGQGSTFYFTLPAADE